MKNFFIKLVLFVLTVFSGFQSVEAKIQVWVPPEGYREAESDEIGMKYEKVEDLDMAAQRKEFSMEEIFGDEQVFPFPPGLGN